MRFFKIQNSSFINLIGLTVGITSVLAIMMWVEDELTFDAFHKDSNAIYRVLVEENGMSGYTNSAMTMPPVAEVLQENLPEVEKVTNFESNWNVVVKAGDDYLNENGMAVVAPNFFDIFSFPVIKGNPHRLDNEKFTVALSQKTAKKYFGDEEPLGKSIEINKKPVTVVAIFKDITYSSHITFDLLIPIALCQSMFGRDKKSDWGRQCLYTYVKVKPNVTQEQLSSKLYDVLASHSPRKDMKLLAQSLKEIHFQKNLADEDYTNLGNKSYVYIFSFLGLFILMLACINYINLSTAESEKDILNNGIRKLLGANKSGLIRSSLVKYITTSAIATTSALLILFLLLPFINNFTGKTLVFNLFTPLHILFIVSISVITGVLSGFYPAFSMASFSSIRVIKKSAYTGGALRQWLTVFQFSLSVLLIVATLVSLRQFKHISNANTGFDKEHVLYFRLEPQGNSYLSLKKKLLKTPQIEKVAGKNYYSSTILNTVSVKLPKYGTENIIFDYNSIDEDFIPLLKVKMLDGQNFSVESKSQWDNRVIINKKALELFDENPIGESIYFSGKEYKIAGIIDKTHFKSLNKSIQPELYIFEHNPHYIFVKYLNGTNVNQLTSQITSVVKGMYPEAPLDFHFLDTTYEKLYENDKKFGSLFAIMAVIAIIISSIGLFALSRFATEKRFKEIGIRKINGAKISEVLILLNKDFVKWVVIAFFIATPIAYYGMNKWLENFAYKTTLSWWIFALAGVLAFGIALLTVSWQSWRAATKNPVEALRYE